MKVCLACNRNIRKSSTCRLRFVGQIRYGDETRKNWAEKKKKCPGCKVKIGGFHHEGCKIEECPECGKALMSCECNHRDYIRR